MGGSPGNWTISLLSLLTQKYYYVVSSTNNLVETSTLYKVTILILHYNFYLCVIKPLELVQL